MLFSQRLVELVVAYKLLTSAPVLGGQITVVDGVIGGVPSDASAKIGGFKEAISLNTIVTTPGALRVKENSGICESTPGVYQASGYGDLTENKSIWFWFFAARKNPETAPLVLWFNGGPGSSSMTGIFQELGPCRITNDSSTVVLNPESWNNNANVMFIDQPIGAGFSHGITTVGGSQKAAVDVWSFLQIWLKDSRFTKFQGRKLAIWTESYGGHYGPVFSAHFLEQNAAIAAGTITGINLNLQVLGVGNGLTDPITQYPGYLTYAASNPYHSLVSKATITNATTAWNAATTGCKARITACNNNGTNSVCSDAQIYCNENILSPLAGNWDVYYVPTAKPDPYPPSFTVWIESVANKIGAESEYTEFNEQVYSNFAVTGDWMRTSKPHLEKVINAGVRTLIFDGDADYILNFNGVEAMVNSLNTKFSAVYNAQNFSSYTVSGQPAGLFKNSGTFSYVRIFGAGHEVPAYKYGSLKYGQAASQYFNQIMANQSLAST